MQIALMLLFVLSVPLAVMLLARRWRWINTVSPMAVLYVIGLLVANIIPLPKQTLAVNSRLGDVAVILSIPLMLMGCSLKGWSTRLALKVFVSGLFSVLLVSVGGFFLFRGNSDSRVFAQICGAASGIYTGGIANIGAIARGVGMDNTSYLFLTSYDLIGTGLYLIFVILFGKRFFRKILGTSQRQKILTNDAAAVSEDAKERKVSKKSPLGHYLGVIGSAIVIAAIAYGVSYLIGGELNMMALILTLTTLSIGASFLPPVRKQQVSFDMGLYCVYVFCFSIACACNIRELDLLGSLNILYYIFFVIFGSILLQVLLARLLHIDGDSVMVCSVALINSPPFVPMVAALLDNKNVVMLGISIGLLGYMLGSYVGIGIFQLLLQFA